MYATTTVASFEAYRGDDLSAGETFLLSSDHLQTRPIPAEALATRHRASDTVWALRPPSSLFQLSLEPFAVRVAGVNDLQGADCKDAKIQGQCLAHVPHTHALQTPTILLKCADLLLREYSTAGLPAQANNQKP